MVDSQETHEANATTVNDSEEQTHLSVCTSASLCKGVLKNSWKHLTSLFFLKLFAPLVTAPFTYCILEPHLQKRSHFVFAFSEGGMLISFWTESWNGEGGSPVGLSSKSIYFNWPELPGGWITYLNISPCRDFLFL